MKIPELQDLYRIMKTNNVQHQRFEVKTNSIIFECIFSAPPFELSMTTKGTKKPTFFLFNVEQGFNINAYFESSQFEALLSLLKTNGNSKNKLQTSEWLKSVASQIPKKISLEPNQAEICNLRHDLEERDKPYFDSWINWKKGQKPSKENLLKTRIIIGEKAYQYSQKNNCSSRWSAIN